MLLHEVRLFVTSMTGKEESYIKIHEKKQRAIGRGSRKCKRCGTYRGIIRRADLMICRRCMREIAPSLGFKKTGSRGG